MVFELPEDTLPVEHTARVLWRMLDKVDLTVFDANVRAVEGSAGRRSPR